MPTIKTRIDDETYRELVKKRKDAGLPSVSALFLHKCGVLTDDKQATEIVQKGIKRAQRKESGVEFRLRDLFPDDEWKQFSKGARLRAGKLFYGRISTAVFGIRASRKSPSNQQMYVVA